MKTRTRSTRKRTKATARRGRWRPGESGNPAGRPPTGAALSELVRAEVDTVALVKRMQWLADHATNETVRFHALAWLADRGWGKAPVEVKISKKNPFAGKVKGLSEAQLLALAALDEDPDDFEDAGDSVEDAGDTPAN